MSINGIFLKCMKHNRYFEIYNRKLCLLDTDVDVITVGRRLPSNCKFGK